MQDACQFSYGSCDGALEERWSPVPPYIIPLKNSHVVCEARKSQTMDIGHLFVFKSFFILLFHRTFASNIKKEDYCSAESSPVDVPRLEEQLKKIREFHNKDFTTPKDIREMIQLFREQQKTGFEEKKPLTMVPKTVHLKECKCDREVFVTDESVDLQKKFVYSTCSEHAFLRGSNQNVISFAFYGDPNSKKHEERQYFDGIYKNYRAINELYNNRKQNFIMRLYHNLDQKSVHFAKLCSFACQSPNLDLCNAEKIPGKVSSLRKYMWVIEIATVQL